MSVPAITINKVCLSGINALYLADQMIQAGDAEVVVAGGMESMTNAPYLLPKARAGYRMGNGELVDSLIHDGLWCAFDVHAHGRGHRAVHRRASVASPASCRTSSRPSSHERAAAAMKEGRFADEIVPVPVPQRKGDPVLVRGGRGRAARRPRSSRSASCAPRSRRTARSPPATPRRSPTAPPR